MSIGNSDHYLFMVEESHRFALDEVTLRVVRRTHDGYQPMSLTLESAGDPVPSGSDYQIPESTIPRELAELMLGAFGRYFLSSEGDVVATNQRLRSELRRVTKQLDDLIAGIGRLGGSQ